MSLKVADLIDNHSGQWKQVEIREMFDPKDADFILKIRTSSFLTDTWIWGMSKSGVYTTKTGYALADKICEMNVETSNPLPPRERALWKQI